MVTARQKTTITGRQMTCGFDMDDHHLQKNEIGERLELIEDKFQWCSGLLIDLLRFDKFNLWANYLESKGYGLKVRVKFAQYRGTRVVVIDHTKYIERRSTIYERGVKVNDCT